MKLYFDDHGFDGQLQRTVGKSDAGMANVGECLYIASQIAAGDRDSWYGAWSAFADGLVAQATAAEEAGHFVSAASMRLRASEYYRQAFFWHRENLDGKELTTAYPASVDAFRRSLPHLPRTGRVIEGDTPGYLFAPPGDGPFQRSSTSAATTTLQRSSSRPPTRPSTGAGPSLPSTAQAKAAFSMIAVCRSARTGSMSCRACSNLSRAFLRSTPNESHLSDARSAGC